MKAFVEKVQILLLLLIPQPYHFGPLFCSLASLEFVSISSPVSFELPILLFLHLDTLPFEKVRQS